MAPTVVLRHELPDGSWHHDWLIARSDAPGAPDDRTLVAFRVMVGRPGEPGQDAFDATRLPDHRVRYLTHEGPLPPIRGAGTGDDRGTVSLQAHGDASIRSESPREIRLRIDWGEGERALRGRMIDPDPGGPESAWTFSPI